MKTINILSYVCLIAILLITICGIFNITFKYTNYVLTFLLVSFSILFVLSAYFTKKSKK